MERLLPFHQLSVQREMALPSSGQKLQEKNMALLAALPSLPSALASVSSYLAVLASEGLSTCTHTQHALLLSVYCPSLPSPPLPQLALPRAALLHPSCAGPCRNSCTSCIAPSKVTQLAHAVKRLICITQGVVFRCSCFCYPWNALTVQVWGVYSLPKSRWNTSCRY